MGENATADLKSVEEAETVLDSTPVSPLMRSMPLATAQGLRLAREILADRDSPPFHKSLMDGYAVRSADLPNMHILQLAGEIAAGQAAATELTPGQTMSIMTGAPLPRGADGVVPVEDAERLNNGQVRIVRPGNPERFVARQGSDCRAGQVVLPRGRILNPPQLAVAASVGASQIDVYAPVRVAVLCTGDELVSIDQTPGVTQIRNCNEIMLAALLRNMRCDVQSMGCVRDDVSIIREKILEGMRSDVLLVTGGMSMGKYDHVPAILREMGVEFKISKLRIKPGKPFVFGVKSDAERMRYIFGLPGNPVSAFVCTMRLVARLIRRLGGAAPDENWLTGTLTSALEANGPREFYQPAILEQSRVTPLAWKGSADIYTLAQANTLLVRPENDPARSPGDSVRLIAI